MSPRVSLCLIARDEAGRLSRCLESAAGAVDEIIVVDTGSTDATPEIARRHGAMVLCVAWADDFSAARNASLEAATGDWILILDADEELAPGAAAALRRLLADPVAEGYFVKIVNFVGRAGSGEAFPDVVFRLFRNRPEYRFRGAIHEQIAEVIREQNPEAEFRIDTDVVILHYGYLDQSLAEKDKPARNLALLEREVAVRPDDHLLRYHYGVELFRAGRHREAAEAFVQAGSGIDARTIYLPKLLRQLVLAYWAGGLPEKALETVAGGLQLFPDYADLYYYGGVICLGRRSYAQAYEYFRKALATPEQPIHYAPHPGHRGFRCHYQLAQLAEKFCNPEEAMRHYLLSLRDAPEFTPALESIVRLLEPHQDPAYAKECIEKTCVLMTPQAHLTLAELFFRQRAYGLALEYLERGLENTAAPPSLLLLWRAICLLHVQRYLEGLKALDQLAGDARVRPLALLNQAFFFWVQGNRRRVRQLVADLIELGLTPETETVVRVLQASLRKTKGPKAALGPEGMALALGLVQRALDLRQPERAEALLGAVDPDSLAEHGLAVAEAYRRYGYPLLARRYLELRLARHPDCAATTCALAESSEESGQYLEAAALYRRAIALDPLEPRPYVRLVETYEKLRQTLLKEVSGEA
ncbi:MAG TPA: glycosyltransferase [Firmicutes bacterium]|nr:glycosyltransferase [Bacillota bacterium]